MRPPIIMVRHIYHVTWRDHNTIVNFFFLHFLFSLTNHNCKKSVSESHMVSLQPSPYIENATSVLALVVKLYRMMEWSTLSHLQNNLIRNIYCTFYLLKKPQFFWIQFQQWTVCVILKYESSSLIDFICSWCNSRGRFLENGPRIPHPQCVMNCFRNIWTQNLSVLCFLDLKRD